jgi:hypothetical protein
MLENPKFLQGLYPFTGRGLANPLSIDPALSYRVPTDKRAQLIYFRAGNSSPEMIYLVLLRNGEPLRFFPIGAKGATHVPLAVVPDLLPDDVLDVALAAPEDLTGSVLLDIGLVEV